VDFAYSPPLGTANDAMNMVAYVAENRLSGYGPSISVEELDAWVAANDPVVVDVRDGFAFEKSHVEGAVNLPLEVLMEQAAALPAGRPVLVYDETGKKGHQAARFLIGSRGGQILNVTGGHQSLQRHARAIGFSKIGIGLLPVAAKSLEGQAAPESSKPSAPPVQPPKAAGPLIVDVRTIGEFATGAYPGAVNIPLDELPERIGELGAADREIVLYCASGARSGYAARLLAQAGFTKVTNGGGLVQMMRRGR
jgi:rhodanese-related sulfurtransferase